MKLPDGNNKFPVFEMHNNNITSIISIVCMTDSDIHFMVDRINQDARIYVSIYGWVMSHSKCVSTEISEVISSHCNRAFKQIM